MSRGGGDDRGRSGRRQPGRSGEPRQRRQQGQDAQVRRGGRGGQPRGRAGEPGGVERRGGRDDVAGLGGTQVEGRHAVRELLVARRRRVRDVWLTDGNDDAPILGEIEALAADSGVPVRRVARARLEAEAATAAPQGVLAHAAPVADGDLADLAAPLADGTRPFLVVLDGITDPGNAGAVLRSAQCAGATGVVLPRHRSAHLTPAAVKAAAGAVEHLRFALVPGIPAALSDLSDLKVWTVGLDADGTTSIFDLELATEPVALVLGAEGAGLSRLVRERCDVLARIPQSGAIASLNVSAAAAVACFEVARRRGAD